MTGKTWISKTWSMSPEWIVDMYKPHVMYARCMNEIHGVVDSDCVCTVFVERYSDTLWELQCYMPLHALGAEKDVTDPCEVILILTHDIPALSPELMRELGRKAVTRGPSAEDYGPLTNMVSLPLMDLFPLIDT